MDEGATERFLPPTEAELLRADRIAAGGLGSLFDGALFDVLDGVQDVASALVASAREQLTPFFGREGAGASEDDELARQVSAALVACIIFGFVCGLLGCVGFVMRAALRQTQEMDAYGYSRTLQPGWHVGGGELPETAATDEQHVPQLAESHDRWLRRVTAEAAEVVDRRRDGDAANGMGGVASGRAEAAVSGSHRSARGGAGVDGPIPPPRDPGGASELARTMKAEISHLVRSNIHSNTSAIPIRSSMRGESSSERVIGTVAPCAAAGSAVARLNQAAAASGLSGMVVQPAPPAADPPRKAGRPSAIVDYHF